MGDSFGGGAQGAGGGGDELDAVEVGVQADVPGAELGEEAALGSG